jgi:hypothetical protein
MTTLVPIDTYRRLTGDTTTADATVDEKLTDAQELVAEYLRRPLDQAQRTERLRLYRYQGATTGFDGAWAVYPKATPIDVAATVGYTVLGSALVGITPDDGPWLYGSYESGGYATVTYTGGWTSASLPLTVAREICRTAKALLTPSATDVAAGAKLVQVGDIRVAYGPAGAVSGALDATSQEQLRRYIRRRAS